MLCGTIGLHSAMAEVFEEVVIDCVTLYFMKKSECSQFLKGIGALYDAFSVHRHT